MERAEELFFETLEEIANGNEVAEGFRIDDDQHAEWALRKVKAEREETARLVADCDMEIARYQKLKAEIEERGKKRESGSMYYLRQYFGCVKHKVTKTQESYGLPMGTLIVKKPAPKVVRDDEILGRWMQENAPDFIETVVKPKWGDFKKTLKTVGNSYFTADGEEVDGVTLEEQEETFDVKLR